VAKAPDIQLADFQIAMPCANLIGESPVWSVREQALYWIDVEAKLVQRLDPGNGNLRRWTMPEVTSCIGLRAHGGLVAGTRTGFVFLDTETGGVTGIAHPEADIPTNRFNDGKVDRAGRFWAGTKNIANSPDATGSVYRLDRNCIAHCVDSGISCVNGIAWSLDERTMYLCDTWLRRIYRYDFDRETGIARNRRVFAELSTEDGYPDGLTVDAEGFVWNAHYDGWRITRRTRWTRRPRAAHARAARYQRYFRRGRFANAVRHLRIVTAHARSAWASATRWTCVRTRAGRRRHPRAAISRMMR